MKDNFNTPIIGREKRERETRPFRKDFLQPIDAKTGKVNKEFDQTYGQKTINPFWGTDKDPRKERKEFFKVKNEYERYEKQMSEKEKSQYARYLNDPKIRVNALRLDR